MPRAKLDMPQKYIFSTKIKVRITDLNYGNHLANDTLLSLLHESRVRFLTRLGYTELDVAGVGTIMSDVVIIYKNQAYYGDTLLVEMAVSDFSRKSCDFYYRITNQDAKLIANCKTGITFFDYALKKPVNVPALFKQGTESPDQSINE